MDKARGQAAGRAGAFGAVVGFGMVVLAIIAIFVLSAVFGWHGTARGVAWLICFAVALAVAIPVTVRSAMAERKAISRQEQPRDGDG